MADLIDRKTTITVYCHRSACNHHAVLDLEKVATKLGREHSYLHDDLIPKLVCSKCGGKNLGMIVSPFTNCANAMSGSSN